CLPIGLQAIQHLDSLLRRGEHSREQFTSLRGGNGMECVDRRAKKCQYDALSDSGTHAQAKETSGRDAVQVWQHEHWVIAIAEQRKNFIRANWDCRAPHGEFC